MTKYSLQTIILIYTSISAILIAFVFAFLVLSKHKQSLEYDTLHKMHLVAKDIVEHKIYLNEEQTLKNLLLFYNNFYIKEDVDMIKNIDFSYKNEMPFQLGKLQVLQRLPNDKFLLLGFDKKYIHEQMYSLTVDLFVGFLIALSFILGLFYFLLKKLFYPLKCLAKYCNTNGENAQIISTCDGSFEVNALKEAILILQRRNQELCKEKQNIFKEAAHEIKTPIAILKARLDLFFKSDMKKETFVKESKNDIFTISNKLRELLFLKAIEWDIQQAKESVAMQNQCSVMQQLFRPILEKKKLEMVSNLEEDFNLVIHKEAMGRVMQAIFENIFMHTKNGTTIQTFIDSKTNTLRIVNEIALQSNEILFSSHIGTKLIERLAPELEYKYKTYQKDNFFYTEITFEGQNI